MRTDSGVATAMAYDRTGVELELAGKPLARLEGGAARLVTDKSGAPRALLGIAPTPQRVTLRLPGRPPRRVTLAPNQQIVLNQPLAS